MKYFFSERGNVVMTFDDIETTCDGKEFIKICFDFHGDFMWSTLPALQPEIVSGIPEMMQNTLLDYARENADEIWKLAREKRLESCKAKSQNSSS